MTFGPWQGDHPPYLRPAFGTTVDQGSTDPEPKTPREAKSDEGP